MKLICSLLVVAGVFLLGASMFWPKLDNGSSSWSEEQAAAYQEVSARLHGLSFRDRNDPENKQLYDQAESEYKVLDGELQSARTRGSRAAFWLKIAGGVLAAIGGVGIFLQRDSR